MKPLTRCKHAAAGKQAAAVEYRAAAIAAREAGHSLREIAVAFGTSHVAVLKLLRG